MTSIPKGLVAYDDVVGLANSHMALCTIKDTNNLSSFLDCVNEVLFTLATEIQESGDFSVCACKVHSFRDLPFDGGCVAVPVSNLGPIAAAAEQVHGSCMADPGVRERDSQVAKLLLSDFNYVGFWTRDLKYGTEYAASNGVPGRLFGAQYCYMDGVRSRYTWRVARVLGGAPLIADVVRSYMLFGRADGVTYALSKVHDGYYHLEPSSDASAMSMRQLVFVMLTIALNEAGLSRVGYTQVGQPVACSSLSWYEEVQLSEGLTTTSSFDADVELSVGYQRARTHEACVILGNRIKLHKDRRGVIAQWLEDFDFPTTDGCIAVAAHVCCTRILDPDAEFPYPQVAVDEARAYVEGERTHFMKFHGVDGALVAIDYEFLHAHGFTEWIDPVSGSRQTVERMVVDLFMVFCVTLSRCIPNSFVFPYVLERIRRIRLGTV